MSELFGIGIETLDDDGFHFYQTIPIWKLLEATEIDNCNELPTPTKVDAPLETDDNGADAKRDQLN